MLIERATHRRFPAVAALAAMAGMAGAAIAQPVNDNCANAVAIGNGTVAGSTSSATNDGSATCGASGSNVDVWYRYTAPATATITVTTCNPGTAYDTVVSVHSANCPGTTGTQIACNDDASCTFNGLFSTLTFQAISGTQYLIRVSGFSSSRGNFELSVGPGGGGQPPVNDGCSNATTISHGQTLNGTTNNAAADGSSGCAGNTSPDVYYTYTAPSAGTVYVSTCPAASFDTVISVHTGCPASLLNQVTCNNDSCGTRSQTTFTATSGAQYVIRVAGNNTAGTFSLFVGSNPPPAPMGPDVILIGTNTTNLGALGGVRAYSIGSSTCNIGDQNLLWTNYGTPALAMNAYRLHNGRLMQLGQSFCKTACCAAAGNGCGLSCNGAGGNVLGAGCLDVYGASYNANQGHLSPRSAINAYTGSMDAFPHTSGDVLFRRLQVVQAELNTLTYPGSLFFVEGVYVGTDDAVAGNSMNNASYLRVTVDQTNWNMPSAGATVVGIPAIRAWKDHGLGANVPDPSVNVFTVDVPSEGRFWVATKVTNLPSGRYLYDYAVFNLNSDRSGGSFSVPLAAGSNPSGVGFRDVNSHSGEPYDNTDWASSIASAQVTWRSPQTFAQNPNSNALRWGTMYNFWFEAETPPATGSITLGLFKPHTPQSVSFDGPVPSPGCAADWNGDGGVNSQDFFDFLADFFAGNADFNNDGQTTSQDFFDFLNVFFVPC